MKFTLSTTKHSYHEDDNSSIDRLKTLGFTFKPSESGNTFGGGWIIDNEPSIDINNISELSRFLQDFGTCVIDVCKDGTGTIEIYNGWRE